jgi:hypothetical protein
MRAHEPIPIKSIGLERPRYPRDPLALSTISLGDWGGWLVWVWLAAVDQFPDVSWWELLGLDRGGWRGAGKSDGSNPPGSGRDGQLAVLHITGPIGYHHCT